MVTEIKRFVSYIYLYNEGVRANNVGFAKVDSRNGQCKIAVNIKGLEQSNGRSEKVYLFYRKQEKLFGIYIGSFQILNGIGEFHEQLQAHNLKATGMALDEMNGILVREEDGNARVYASGWDDYAISVNQFFLHEEESGRAYYEERTQEQLHASEVEEKRREPVIFYDRTWKEEAGVAEQPAEMEEVRENERIKEPVQEMEQGIEGVQRENLLWDEAYIHDESMQGNQEVSGAEDIQQSKAVPNTEGMNRNESAANTESMQNTESIQEERTYFPEFQNSSNTWEQISWQEYQKNPQQCGKENAENMQEDKACQDMTQDVREDKACQDMTQDIRERQDWQEPNNMQESEVFLDEEIEETAWERLCHQFPKIRAFVDEPECLCLKIDLKDLRLLPSENWVLGNNSFLLHGYYNFRYLILTQEKESYVLGIPGIYHPNEKMMASMFGFGGFKPVKACDKMLGQFGYWCKRVTL